jgi:hypothetical protein
VYKEAGVTQADMNAYYDRLTESAQQQLLDRELVSPNGNQLRAYMRMRAAMLAEQAAVTNQIEAEKNQARQRFNRTLGRELFQVLVRSPGGQSLLGDLRQSINELRQAAQAVESAIAGNRPFDLLAQELADKAGRIPLLRRTAYDLGQKAGHKIDQLLGGVIGKLDGAMANMQAGMGDALTEINRIDSELARFDETERQPVSLVEEGGPLGAIHGVDRANAAVDVAAQAFTNAALLAGAFRNATPQQAESMRARIRQQLLQNRLERLSQIAQRARHVSCTAAGREGYIQAANQLGLAVEQPADPTGAAYIVCRDVGTGELIHAALLSPTSEELAAEPSEEAAEASEEASQQENEVAAQALPPDRCPLRGEGDFIIENFTNISESTTCDADDRYPFDLPAEPLLLMLASSGRWVVVDANEFETSWEWQQTEPAEGASLAGTATAAGSSLEIDVSIDFGPSNASNPLQPAHANGLAVLATLPLFPIGFLFTQGRKRRWLLLALAFFSLLLMAQSCDVYGTFNGSYSFPLPQEGFACEIAPENPNLAEMPGSTGEVVMEVTIVDIDEAGNATSSETCDHSASVTGLGVLKRDGVYTQDSLE